MKKRMKQWTALLLIAVLALCGCQESKGGRPVQTREPNASVTYEKGRDFVGVIKGVGQEDMTITFYQPDREEEVSYTYSSGTEILSKSGKQISSQSLEAGQVVDVYLNESRAKVVKVQISSDILEYEQVRGIKANQDEAYLEVEGVKYRYGSGFSVFSDGQTMDLQEITFQDEVTFRGVKGKAYSLVVTRGHGYVKPVKYKDFVGGTMTIGGVAILPVTEKMLIPVPEGTYEVTMKNGDFVGSRQVQVERDKQHELDMSLFKSTQKNTGQVVFDIKPVGAELYVNGSLTGYDKPVSLKYGRHSVRAVLDGYTTYAGVIDVQSANPTVRINLAEEEAGVSDGDTSVSDGEDEGSSVSDQYDNDHDITVSTPAGASVYLDGVYKGKTPCSFAKKIGNITITLAKDGCITKSYSVTTTDDGKDIQWSFPDLVQTAAG